MKRQLSWIHKAHDLLLYLDRSSNFDTSEYMASMGIGTSTAKCQLSSLQEAGFIELVTWGGGSSGGSVWRSLVRTEFLQPHHGGKDE